MLRQVSRAKPPIFQSIAAQPIAAQWNRVAQCKAVEGLEAFVFSNFPSTSFSKSLIYAMCINVHMNV